MRILLGLLHCSLDINYYNECFYDVLLVYLNVLVILSNEGYFAWSFSRLFGYYNIIVLSGNTFYFPGEKLTINFCTFCLISFGRTNFVHYKKPKFIDHKFIFFDVPSIKFINH